ncbi:MAG: thioredoxin family protein [Desulfobacteraceae bacterium]|nr:thioredoxin family protein [Desulfobacteraceae bacterium]
MNKKNVFWAVLVFVLMTTILNTEAFASDGIKWNNHKEGLFLSEKQNKKIFLYFHADWCTFCKKLKDTTFKNREVIDYLNENFISISVDSDKEKSLSKKFGVRGLPTLFFLKPNSDRIHGRPGYMDASLFLKVLKYINTDSYEKMKLSDYVKTL